jgi:hypothetical protein
METKMANTFSSTHSAYYDNADWLDNAASFSFAVWVNLAAVTTGSRQYVFSHYGATNRISLRKDNGATEYFRFAVVSGGISATVDDTTGTPVAGTPYHIAGTWTPGSATGIAIYRNGALVDTGNTTSQTANYDSGGSVDLYLGARAVSSNYLNGSIENLCLWPGTVLTPAQILELYYSGWWQLANVTRPACQYACQTSITRIPDLSGNGRHIESATIDTTGVTLTPSIGKWDDLTVGQGITQQQGAAYTPPAPDDPDPWTLHGYVTHPTTTDTVTGLTNGTEYEFAVAALDVDGNVSEKCSAVACTPHDIPIKHTRRWRIGGR